MLLELFFNMKLNRDCSVTILKSMKVSINLFNDLDYCRVFVHRSYFMSDSFMKLVKLMFSLDI